LPVDRRAEFIEIAIRLFSGRPYADVSIDEIAKEAGAAKGLLYYYFGDKQGLYIAGFEQLAREMHEQIAAASAETADTATPLERLMRGIDAHLAFIEQYPTGYRELLSSASTHPEVRAIMSGEQDALIGLLLAGLPPEVPVGPSVMLAVKGWGSFVDGAVLAWLTDGGIDRGHVCELCSRVLYGAIIAAIEVDKKG
jgi:AcrR family transcriptional regulator